MSLKLSPGFRGRGASFAFADSSPSKIDRRLIALAKSKIGSFSTSSGKKGKKKGRGKGKTGKGKRGGRGKKKTITPPVTKPPLKKGATKGKKKKKGKK